MVCFLLVGLNQSKSNLLLKTQANSVVNFYRTRIFCDCFVGGWLFLRYAGLCGMVRFLIISRRNTEVGFKGLAKRVQRRVMQKI